MEDLLKIVKEEVRKYGGSGLNVKLFPVLDDEQAYYAVTAVGYPQRKHPMNVVVMARVEGEMIIIEEDRSDKPLVDALLQRGIPRQQIVLAYVGEAVAV